MGDTEYAGDWILKEPDPLVVELLLDLFSCEPGSEEGRRIRRALLERRVLCSECVRLMGDKAVMADVRGHPGRAPQVLLSDRQSQRIVSTN